MTVCLRFLNVQVLAIVFFKTNRFLCKNYMTPCTKHTLCAKEQLMQLPNVNKIRIHSCYLFSDISTNLLLLTLTFFISLKPNYNGTENIINTDYYNKCSTNVAVHGGNNRVLVKYYNILHLHII